MAKLFGCHSCFVELERVLLADGSAVLMCITCDTMGLEAEFAEGGPVWPANMGRRQAVVTPFVHAVKGKTRKKPTSITPSRAMRMSGKKSLTA